MELKQELMEQRLYKKGYESAIKSQKKDMVSLKFVGKMKTNQIQKYSKQLKSRKEFTDQTDIREPLKCFLENDKPNFSKASYKEINSHNKNTDFLSNSSSYYQQKLRTLSSIGVSVTFTEFIEVIQKICSSAEAEFDERVKRLKDELVQTRRSAARFQNQLNSQSQKVLFLQ